MLYLPPRLTPEDLAVIDRVEELRQKLRNRVVAVKQWTGSLRRVAFAKAIQGSNSIEGHNVSTLEAVAAVLRDERGQASKEDWAAVTGYRQAMGLILQVADDPGVPCSNELIRSLHYMIIGHDPGKNPGKWRTGLIYVRDEKRNLILYEGPDADLVPSLMDEFVESLKSYGDLPTLVKGIMTHLNLVLVHPFSDGNGRIARCLQSLLLARNGVLGPEFCSIEDYLGRNTSEYYKALGAVSRGKWNPENDAAPFVRFCLKAHFQQANEFLAWDRCFERIWNELERDLQRLGLPDRCLFALSDAVFAGEIKNSTYRIVADISELSAGRDLKQLVQANFLSPKGEKRGRVYRPALALRKLANRIFGEEGKRVLEDPYELPPRQLA